jgi:hypothetical protein
MGMLERGRGYSKVTEVIERQWSVISGQWPVTPSLIYWPLITDHWPLPLDFCGQHFADSADYLALVIVQGQELEAVAETLAVTDYGADL